MHEEAQTGLSRDRSVVLRRRDASAFALLSHDGGRIVIAAFIASAQHAFIYTATNSNSCREPGKVFSQLWKLRCAVFSQSTQLHFLNRPIIGVQSRQSVNGLARLTGQGVSEVAKGENCTGALAKVCSLLHDIAALNGLFNCFIEFHFF